MKIFVICSLVFWFLQIALAVPVFDAKNEIVKNIVASKGEKSSDSTNNMIINRAEFDFKSKFDEKSILLNFILIFLLLLLLFNSITIS